MPSHTAPAGPLSSFDRVRRADRKYGVHLLGSAAGAAAAAVLFGLVLVLVEAHWEPLRRMDTGAAGTLHHFALRHHEWTRVLAFVSNWILGPGILRTAVALLTLWLLYRRAWRLAAWSAVTAGAGALTGMLVKAIVERTRPALSDPVAHAPGYSFPSGHAMTATTSFAIFLLVLLPLVPRAAHWLCWLISALAVVGVGFTRVALGVHWCSDVIGGWLLGLTVIAATTWAFRLWRADARRPAAPVTDGLEPELDAPHPEPSRPHDS
ncbi:phosphatase PAP2 family protein [Actinacidiphila paucisporea]|uniref:Undecaprenyl-diphosphatase n=1 Tax=Actinacidiphila paucisporea TaxID=310782 RepID=A0A1M7MNQ7_9ACTN|nr:phosphatase PAP2 family protein [Actinacidiphila paucisporea]SHM92633.1 undecaprenyl-diphosphatase [Actinacidiphila paucisporea]